jgi:peroxiredoxin
MPNTSQLSLREQIVRLQRRYAKNIPADKFEQIRAARAEMLRSTSKGSSLHRGDKAPEFSLPDAYGKLVTLSSLLKTGSVVLTFYRGDWCPFCSLTLRAYHAILPGIKALHGSLVAISPQNPDHTLLTMEHGKLTYPVLSDVGNKVARQYTMMWTVPEVERSDEDGSHYDNTSWELPVPATFVIGLDCTIKLAFADPDYTQRLEPTAILEALRQLK